MHHCVGSEPTLPAAFTVESVYVLAFNGLVTLSDQDGILRCSIEHLQLWGGRRLEEVDFNLDAVLDNRSACSKILQDGILEYLVRILLLENLASD